MAHEPKPTPGAARQRSPRELAEVLAAMSAGPGEVAPPRPRQRAAPPPRASAASPPADPPPPPSPSPAGPPASAPPPPAHTEAPAAHRPTVEPDQPAALQPPVEPIRPDEPDEPEPPTAPAVRALDDGHEMGVVAGTPIIESDARTPREPPVGRAVPAPADRQDGGPEPGDRPRLSSRAAGRIGRREPIRRGRGRTRTRRRPSKGRGLGARPVRSRGRERLRLLAFGAVLVVLAVVVLAAVGGSASNTTSTADHSSIVGTARTVPVSPLPAPSARTHRPAQHRGHRSATSKPAPANRSGTRPLLVPAYFLPGVQWAQAIAEQPMSVFIVSPDGGPGTRPIPALRGEIRAVRRAGGRLLAYVNTDGGLRPTRAVEQDLQRYHSWYGLHNVFLAGSASSATFLPYYRQLASYARAHGAHRVVLDPSTVPARGYFGVADVVVTFEGPYARYRTARFPSWLRGYSPSQQANIVTAAPTAADAHTALELARARGVGIAYVTATGGAHPYGGVPPYFAREAAWLAAGPLRPR